MLPAVDAHGERGERDPYLLGGERQGHGAGKAGPYHHVPAEPGVVDHCTMRGYWQLGLRRLDGRWLITRWAVLRTGPWEGSPDVYALAAARGTARS